MFFPKRALLAVTCARWSVSVLPVCGGLNSVHVLLTRPLQLDVSGQIWVECVTMPASHFMSISLVIRSEL